ARPRPEAAAGRARNRSPKPIKADIRSAVTKCYRHARHRLGTTLTRIGAPMIRHDPFLAFPANGDSAPGSRARHYLAVGCPARVVSFV
ncbi:MAG TPA: hypothetical protein VIM36_11655, partial [Gemmatimonadaceae bacterium]